jgi:hypothetical protein
MIILLVIASVVAGAPLLAVVLVTIASLREDAGRSLAGRAPNWIDAAARRLLRAQSSGLSGRAAPRVPRPRTHDHDEAARPRAEPRS